MESIKKTIGGYKSLEFPVYTPYESLNSVNDSDVPRYQFPRYSALIIHDPLRINIPTLVSDKIDNDVFEKEKNRRPVIEYDITRVSSRNAKKGSKGPYKTGELRQIILSYGMGKSNGTKKDLVNTIRSFHTSRT